MLAKRDLISRRKRPNIQGGGDVMARSIFPAFFFVHVGELGDNNICCDSLNVIYIYISTLINYFFKIYETITSYSF